MKARPDASDRVRGCESHARGRTVLAWRCPRCTSTHLLLGQRARLVHLVDDAGRLRLDAHLTTASQQCPSHTPPPLSANRCAGRHRQCDAPAASLCRTRTAPWCSRLCGVRLQRGPHQALSWGASLQVRLTRKLAAHPPAPSRTALAAHGARVVRRVSPVLPPRHQQRPSAEPPHARVCSRLEGRLHQSLCSPRAHVWWCFEVSPPPPHLRHRAAAARRARVMRTRHNL